MIEFLKIRSMAIIDEAEIEFTDGLNCITGETGAGKSLIIGALTLLMGAKAHKDVVRPGRNKAISESIFNQEGKEILLRREIFSSGRSRCFVNGELATVEQLAELSLRLINIYGQHQYQDLLNPGQQMSMLEEMAGIKRGDILDAYERVVTAQNRLVGLENSIN